MNFYANFLTDDVRLKRQPSTFIRKVDMKNKNVPVKQFDDMKQQPERSHKNLLKFNTNKKK